MRGVCNLTAGDMKGDLEQAVCRGWEGFQCGFCGAEFKTKPELVRHQFSNHSQRMGLKEGPVLL